VPSFDPLAVDALRRTLRESWSGLRQASRSDVRDVCASRTAGTRGWMGDAVAVAQPIPDHGAAAIARPITEAQNQCQRTDPLDPVLRGTRGSSPGERSRQRTDVQSAFRR